MKENGSRSKTTTTSSIKQARLSLGDYFLLPFLGRGDGLGLFSVRAEVGRGSGRRGYIHSEGIGGEGSKEPSLVVELEN